MKKSKQTKQTDAVAPSSIVATGNVDPKTIKYVVVRDGHRVSDREYKSETDPVALNELDFWTRVAKNHSYGEPVGIVTYDPKKHRVWGDAD